MIRFRCWYCNRRYKKPSNQIGSKFECHCGWTIRVPKYDGGNCRVKTLVDRLIEAVVCSIGCGLLAFCFSFLVFFRIFSWSPWIIPGMTLGGAIVGLVAGERAIDFFGAIIRDYERDHL